MLVYLQQIDEHHDKDKFEKIYRKYYKLMFYVANQVLHNRHDAEDAVHGAFINIAENIMKIDEVECPKTQNYVVTIAEHKAIDIYRKKQRFLEVETNEEVEGISVEYDGENQLARCILQLPVRYKEIILLRYYQGFSTKEMAQILGITESNASKLLQRAKAKLEKVCREEGVL